MTGAIDDVSPVDGRFLMTMEVNDGSENAPPPQIIIVQNWFHELRERVPAD